MRHSKWRGVAVAVVVGLAGTAAARQDAAEYDLRGPAPVKGQVVVKKSTFKIKDAKVAIKVAGMVLDAKQTLTAVEEEEVKFLAVEGRQVTKAQTRMMKEHVTTVTTLAGQDMDDEKDGDLQGEVIISERTPAGKWKHTLVDSRPTAKQKKELDKRVGPENDDDLYPEGKVKVGHKWTVDASALQRVFGGSITELKGKLGMRLVRVEMFDGEECAVVESKGKITGVAKEDEGDLNVELDMEGLTWRSLKTGLDVKDTAKGRIRMSGKVEMDGQALDLDLSGPITIDGTAKLKTK
ncbi:hypothetical protein J0H58_02535 [bacterium]|nr:hypothetical protein [bacterium]